MVARRSAARGFSSGLSLGGPTKVKAHKSYQFAEGSLKVENKEHLFDFIVTLCVSYILTLASTNSSYQQIKIEGYQYIYFEQIKS